MNKLATYAKLMLQLALSPSRGWEDVAACGADVADVSRRLMQPLFALAGATVFTQPIYHHGLAVSDLVMKAAVIIVSYYAAYFLACAMFRMRLWSYVEEDPAEGKWHAMVAFTLSLLALSTAVCNMLPVSLGLTYLFPLAVTLVAWKANAYLRVRADRDLQFAIFTMCVLTLPPIIIQSAFFWLIAI